MIPALEIAANGVATVSILLAARNSVHTWWTGMLGCLLFGVLFESARLYADVALQGFFILASAIGWWLWRRGNHGRALAVTHAGPRLVGSCLVAGTLAAMAYGAMLHQYTDAVAPLLDSTVLAFSVIAQLLMMQRRIECWPFWILVNSIAVPLFASRGLTLTAALYAAYWLNAWVAWRHWRRLASVPA